MKMGKNLHQTLLECFVGMCVHSESKQNIICTYLQKAIKFYDNKKAAA